MRLLAIDYGKKRCGIAVSDPLQIIANALTTVSPDELIPFLNNYFKQEQVSTIVLGYPLGLDNQATDSTAKVEKLYLRLKRLYADKEIVYWDERYTSKMAQQALIQSGMRKSKRRQKHIIDEVSATIILQEYMESRK